MKWYVDRSRYEAGFHCPWHRLLQYHAAGTGWVPRTEALEPAVGQFIHGCLEAVLTAARDKGSPLTQSEVNNLTLRVPQEPGLSVVEAIGITHAWARAILPWLLDKYEILSAEQEFTLDLGDDIVWMARPDCVVRSKDTGLPCVVEFKTTRSKASTIGALHATSLQSIMNAYAVSSHYNQACGEVQIHTLQLGNEQWPTCITHAYYRPAQPPYVPEDWQPRPRRSDGTWLGKLYRKVAVADHRPIPEWVWSMPMGPLLDTVPITQAVLDAKETGLKVIQAIASIKRNESYWRDLLATVDWSSLTFAEMSDRLPRSFQCRQYNRNCDYAQTCFDPDNHALTLSTTPTNLIPRTPHHLQEGEE